jgi:hypothetical protein
MRKTWNLGNQWDLWVGVRCRRWEIGLAIGLSYLPKHDDGPQYWIYVDLLIWELSVGLIKKWWGKV